MDGNQVNYLNSQYISNAQSRTSKTLADDYYADFTSGDYKYFLSNSFPASGEEHYDYNFGYYKASSVMGTYLSTYEGETDVLKVHLEKGSNGSSFRMYLPKTITGNQITLRFRLASTDENGNHIKETVLYDYCLIAEKSRNLRQKGHDVVTAFCIQLVSDKGLKIRDPECPQDLTFQVALAVAFGAKALEYYLYVGKGCGAITDKKTQKEYSPVYGWIKEANKDLKKYGQILLSAEWQGVKFYNGEKVKDEHNANAFNAFKEYEKENFALLKDFSCYADAIVSEFATENGYAYMAVNYTEPTKNQTNTVVFGFNDCKKATVYIGRTKRTERLKNGKFQIVLPSGGSAVILPE